MILGLPKLGQPWLDRGSHESFFEASSSSAGSSQGLWKPLPNSTQGSWPLITTSVMIVPDVGECPKAWHRLAAAMGGSWQPWKLHGSLLLFSEIRVFLGNPNPMCTRVLETLITLINVSYQGSNYDINDQPWSLMNPVLIKCIRV